MPRSSLQSLDLIHRKTPPYPRRSPRLCGYILVLTILSCRTSLLSSAEPTPEYRDHHNLSYYIDASGKQQPIKTQADWKIRRQHILVSLQKVMGPLPQPSKPVPLDVTVVEEKQIGSLTRQKITYHTDSPDHRLSAYLFLPNRSDKKLPAVLCLHQTTKIGKEEPAGLGGNPQLQYALHLAKRGYVTLAPDYPSLGEYQYDFADKHGYVSGSMKAIYDNIRAVDLLVSLPQVDTKRIGCIGHSLGGHNTMFTAAFEPRIKVLVSSCGYSHMQKDDVPSWSGPRYMPLIASRYGNSADKLPFDFPEIVASFAPRPFFTNATVGDRDFDVTGIKDCITAALPVYQLFGKTANLRAIYPQAPHSFPAMARVAAYKFLDKHLSHTPTETPIQRDANTPTPIYSEHQNLLYYLDAGGNRQPVQSTNDWNIRRRHVLAHIQTVMGPLPKPKKPVPLDVKVVEEVAVSDTLTRRKVTYYTDSPDRRISAYLFLPNAAKKVPAILCLHQTIRIGKEEPAGLGKNENLQYALHLAKRGYVTLAPDYPSFGEYTYDFAPKYGYISGSMKAIYDNIRAVDLLVSLPQVDKERIGCIGHSLGGHNTMFTATFEPRIKVMVSNCGFTRFHKYYRGRLKGWTSTRYMPLINDRYNNDADLVPFDFTEIVASFAPRPFLASSPLRDSNFEVSGVRDVISAAKPIYQLYGQPKNLQANHPDYAHSFPPDVRKVAYDFFDKHLNHTRKTD